MTISGINATTTLQSVAQTQRQRPQPPSLDNTAKLLGTTADDLRTQLQSGKTLDDIASSKGVSSSDLISAVKSDLQANKPADAPQLSDDQLTQMATDVAAGKGPGRAHGHHHHGGGGKQSATSDDDQNAKLQDLASTLGVDPSDLVDALSAGANIGSLLGSSASNPYTAGQTQVDGGLVVDQYA